MLQAYHCICLVAQPLVCTALSVPVSKQPGNRKSMKIPTKIWMILRWFAMSCHVSWRISCGHAVFERTALLKDLIAHSDLTTSKSNIWAPRSQNLKSISVCLDMLGMVSYSFHHVWWSRCRWSRYNLFQTCIGYCNLKLFQTAQVWRPVASTYPC